MDKDLFRQLFKIVQLAQDMGLLKASGWILKQMQKEKICTK